MNTTKLFSLAFITSFAFACGGTGDTGATGETGPVGDRGPTGDIGSRGTIGEAGPNGMLGATGETGAMGTPGMNGTNGTDRTSYAFRTDMANAYTRVDRMGMPAVSTALIADKNRYNDASPNDDIMPGAGGLPQFVESDIAGQLAGLHEALRDDLAGAGLTRCSQGTGMAINILPCATQEVAPGVSVLSLIVPDTLTLDPTAPAGFPNGRLLADPVMDVTLAIILLDLSVHGAGDLVGGLNPAANDVPFDDEFPYLAYPHAN